MKQKMTLITEINRNLSLMGLSQKTLITEAAPPGYKMFKNALKKLLSNVESIPSARGRIKINGVDMTEDTLNKLKLALDNDTVMDLLDDYQLNTLYRIIDADKDLLNRWYVDTLDSLLKQRRKTESEFYKTFAKLFDTAQKRDPTLTLEEFLVQKNINKLDAKILAPRLKNGIDPFRTWEVGTTKIKPYTKGVFGSLEKWWNINQPEILRNFQYKWFLGYRNKLSDVVKRIELELAKAQSDMTQIEGGQLKTLNVIDRMNNIWYLIAGMKRSAAETNYVVELEKYIKNNKYLPEEEVKTFMSQPYVTNSINAASQNMKIGGRQILAKELKSLGELVPILKRPFVQKDVNDMFKDKEWKLWLPHGQKLWNYILWKSPLSVNDMAELSMRGGRTSAIAHYVLNVIVLQYILIPIIQATARTAIENYTMKPEVMDVIKKIKELCPYGLIRNEDGSTIEDCDTFIQEIEYTAEKGFIDYWVNELPFNKIWDQLASDYNIPRKTLDLILNITYTDEVAKFIWNNLYGFAVFRQGDKSFLNVWQKEMDQRYDNAMGDIIKQLKTTNPPIISGDDKTQWKDQLELYVANMTKNNPELQKTGKFKSKLEEFKRWLIDYNEYSTEEANKAYEKDIEENGQKIHLYIIDDVEYIFINGNFLPKNSEQ